MKKYELIFLILHVTCLFAQEKKVDSLYLEDQFYAGVSYLTFQGQGYNNSSSGISYGLKAGFLKDIPFNKKRNFGMALGVGYQLNAIYEDFSLTNPKNTALGTSVILHALEVPLELRWRTSTPTNSAFWRVYLGSTYAYNVGSRLDNGDITNVQFDNALVEKNIFSNYVAVGYATWNLFLEYVWSPLFTQQSNHHNYRLLKIGLQFYIL